MQTESKSFETEVYKYKKRKKVMKKTTKGWAVIHGPLLACM